MTTWEIMVQLPLVLLTVVIHEMLHYLTAYFLGYKPKFEFEKFLVPSVKFINKGRDVHNFIIALAAPTGLVLIGLLILVVIAEDGSIQTHVGTVENHDAHKEKLTDGQKKELKQLLVDMLQ